MELSLWNQVEQLEGHAKSIVESLYGISFPIKARRLMDDWIQSNLPKSVELFTHPIELIASECIERLIRKFMETFSTKIKSLPSGSQGSMNEVLKGLDERQKENPLAFFKFLRHCVHVEQLLVGNAVNSPYGHNWADVGAFVEQFNMLAENMDNSNALMEWLNATMETITTLSSKLEKRNVALDKLRRSSLPLNQRNEFETKIQGEVLQIRQDLDKKTPDLILRRKEFLQRIKYNVDQLAYLQDGVLRKLNYWKSQQERGTNGSFNEGLDTLQLWCCKLAEANLKCRSQLRLANTLEENISKSGIQSEFRDEIDLEELRENLRQIFSKLVQLSFIVEIQPPDVVKKSNKFVARLRSLIGGTRHLLSAPRDVKVSVVSEEIAKGIEREDASFLDKTSGKVSYYSTHMSYNERSGRFVGDFRSLSVHGINKREGGKVCKQKYCIKFETTFIVGGEHFEVSTLSLPVTVAVHCNQEMKAWGPIIWDDIFRSSTGHPFQVKKSTTWDSLAQALNRFFAKETGRHLTPDNLQFLREKFLTSHPQENPQNGFDVNFDTFFQDPVSTLVNQDPVFVFAKQEPVSTFAKGDLVPQEFSFWDWFYTVMKLTKGSLRDHWRKGHIEGFISKQRAAELLRGRPDNTYLLRFTESLKKRTLSKNAKVWIGSVSITWVETQSKSHQILQSLQPFTATDLESRSLSEIISTCKIAKFLYPDILSNSVFQSQGSETRIGYVPLSVTTDAKTNSKESETERDVAASVSETASPDLSNTRMILSQFSLGVEVQASGSIALPSFASQFPQEAMQLIYSPSFNGFIDAELSSGFDDQYNDSILEGILDEDDENSMEYEEL